MKRGNSIIIIFYLYTMKVPMKTSFRARIHKTFITDFKLVELTLQMSYLFGLMLLQLEYNVQAYVNPLAGVVAGLSMMAMSRVSYLVCTQSLKFFVNTGPELHYKTYYYPSANLTM